jgi:hypothetical protein
LQQCGRGAKHPLDDGQLAARGPEVLQLVVPLAGNLGVQLLEPLPVALPQPGPDQLADAGEQAVVGR